MGRRNLTLLVIGAFAFALTACGGGGGSTPVVTPTVAPTITPTIAPQSVTCPSSGSNPSSVSSSTAASVGRAVSNDEPSGAVPGAIAVTYYGDGAALDGAESRMGAQRTGVTSYPSLGLTTRVLSVAPQNVRSVMQTLSSLRGVRSVSRISYRRRLSIAADDKYYVGDPSTAAPYFQTASTFGQWDMHAIDLDGAWSSFASAPVQGAKIAVVDTGVDVSIKEMTGARIVRTRCFVTYPSGTAQTTGSYVTDTDGHGTNVSGIADSFTNNAFGFAGVAYDAPLMAYRIFPSDPSTGCEGSSSNQCSATSFDEASAINDAVANGARVINLSLGGDSGGTCDASDPEYTAVEAAIAAKVVVVAAAGNGDKSGNGLSHLDCPAADPGVIAVGASGLDDSVPSAITEVMAKYSNYVSPSNGRYLVAPGGNAPGSTDADNLHWIENAYSSQAYDASKHTSCTGADVYGELGNCAVLIEGTSQATPHVTGVVSLMLAANPNLTPTQIATGLCASADTINDARMGCGRVNAAKAVAWARAN